MAVQRHCYYSSKYVFYNSGQQPKKASVKQCNRSKVGDFVDLQLYYS